MICNGDTRSKKPTYSCHSRRGRIRVYPITPFRRRTLDTSSCICDQISTERVYCHTSYEPWHPRRQLPKTCICTMYKPGHERLAVPAMRPYRSFKWKRQWRVYASCMRTQRRHTVLCVIAIVIACECRQCHSLDTSFRTNAKQHQISI